MKMTTKAMLLSLTAALALSAAAPSAWAEATNYAGSESFDGEKVDLLITTDGATGALLATDVTAFDIKISDTFGTADISSANGDVFVLFDEGGDTYDNGALTATDQQLIFTFNSSEVDGVQFYNENDSAVYCIQNNGCFNFNGPEIDASSDNNMGHMTMPETNGAFVLADAVSAAPEPSAWALMILGVGLAGVSLRFRRGRGRVGIAETKFLRWQERRQHISL